MNDLSPLWISFKVAFFATLITFVLGIAAARLVISMKRGKSLADGLFSLPMVLPPTVVGFFLLMIFGKNSPIGGALASGSACCLRGREPSLQLRQYLFP